MTILLWSLAVEEPYQIYSGDWSTTAVRSVLYWHGVACRCFIYCAACYTAVIRRSVCVAGHVHLSLVDGAAERPRCATVWWLRTSMSHI